MSDQPSNLHSLLIPNQSNQNRAAGVSWIQTETQTSSHPLVITKSVPPRSLSTFPIGKQQTRTVKAAPFPSPPSKHDVQVEKEKVEEEIKQLKTDLASLQYEQVNFSSGLRQILPGNCKGIREYRGILFATNEIQQILNENKLKSNESSSIFNVKGRPIFRQVYDLPFYVRNIEKQSENLIPFFSVKFAELQLQNEKEEALESEYHSLQQIWKEKTQLLDEINERTFSRNEEWPPEFSSDVQKLTEEQRLKFSAPSIPMILNPALKHVYFDTNSSIEDPKKSYKEFKNKTTWTEEEKQVFIDKYRQKNKKFGFIADELPNKTVKDVIEFYYLNRYRLNLKDNESVVKRRGGKRKMVTEGKKKNY